MKKDYEAFLSARAALLEPLHCMPAMEKLLVLVRFLNKQANYRFMLKRSYRRGIRLEYSGTCTSVATLSKRSRDVKV